MNIREDVRSKFIMVLVIIVVLNLQSCGKYDEGPAISLKSKTKRLAQTWDLAEIDGETPIEDLFDSYSYFGTTIDVNDVDIEFDFQEDGDFEIDATYNVTIESSYYGYYGGYSYSFDYRFDVNIDGEWEFSSDKEDIEINFDDNDYGYSGDFERRDYKILKLTSKELKLEADNGAEWTFES
jgi:hypothetical protein